MENLIEFKRCSCRKMWVTRKQFILDPEVVPIGVSFPPGQSSSRAFYYFNHATCKTTLLIDSEDFADLIEESVPADIKAGEKECEGHCTKKEDLETCAANCRNAPFRRFFLERILAKKM